MAPDSFGPIPIGLGAATDLFCAARAAEGASPRTVEWYRMITVRCVRRFGEARPLDSIGAAELRAWLLELRSTLSPESVAGYVRGLKVGTTTIVQENDLPLLFSGGIYRLRVRETDGMSAALLLALLNMRVVRRQMRNKQFTRDVIDTLGHRLLEIVVPVPTSSRDREMIGSAVSGLLKAREKLRHQAAGLGVLAEGP